MNAIHAAVHARDNDAVVTADEAIPLMCFHLAHAAPTCAASALFLAEWFVFAPNFSASSLGYLTVTLSAAVKILLSADVTAALSDAGIAARDVSTQAYLLTQDRLGLLKGLNFGRAAAETSNHNPQLTSTRVRNSSASPFSTSTAYTATSRRPAVPSVGLLARPHNPPNPNPNPPVQREHEPAPRPLPSRRTQQSQQHQPHPAAHYGAGGRATAPGVISLDDNDDDDDDAALGGFLSSLKRTGSTSSRSSGGRLWD
jgi:hypothetical protein